MTERPTAGGLLVVGELCADIIVALRTDPVFDQTEQIVDSTAIVMGSSSAITANGAAALDVPTTFVGVVGDDLPGRFVLSELESRGVDTLSVRVDPTVATGTSTILTRLDGDRAILTALGSIGRVTVADVPDSALAAARHVHVGSYFMQTGLWGSLGAFFEHCRVRGLTTSLDPNFDPAGTWSSGISEVFAHLDVLFCNETEATGISGAATIEAALDWFGGRLADTCVVVLKLGERGAVAWQMTNGELVKVADVAAPDLGGEFADAVGAGDSLAAGYLAGALHGFPIAGALALGVLNGTASTRAPGGTAGQLTWDEAAGFDRSGRRI